MVPIDTVVSEIQHAKKKYTNSNILHHLAIVGDLDAVIRRCNSINEMVINSTCEMEDWSGNPYTNVSMSSKIFLAFPLAFLGDSSVAGLLLLPLVPCKPSPISWS